MVVINKLWAVLNDVPVTVGFVFSIFVRYNIRFSERTKETTHIHPRVSL